MQRERQAVNDLLCSISSLFPEFKVSICKFETHKCPDNFSALAHLWVKYLDTEFVHIELEHKWGDSNMYVQLYTKGRHCTDIKKIDALREMITNRIKNTLQYKVVELEQLVLSGAPMTISQLN
uniref:Uncharacterized protein n=1 Tax=Clandestinovirus TaxID=2831644 RepID=A0A8F8KPK1_9VIRU|nr:hypothetical protein KOM_12_176 [Clandestinovirus]